MKKNTNLKKNLVKKSVLPAAFAVLGSAIALTSVSYAWFTQGDTATVGNIDVNVSSAAGLQISTGNVADPNWGSIISGTDLVGVGDNKMHEADEINPISTVGKLNAESTDVQFYLGTIANDKYTSVKTDNTNYVQFDLYFDIKCETASNQTGSIWLDTEHSEVVFKGEDKGIQNAVRVAFVDYGHAATLDAATKIKTISGETGGQITAAKIWDPNHKKHSGAVKSKVGTDIIKAADDTLQYNGFAQEFGPVTKDQLTQSSNTEVVTPESNATVKPEISDLTEGINIATVTGMINKVRVYIWVEGQDIDCINDASGSAFTVNLAFAQAKTKIEVQ